VASKPETRFYSAIHKLLPPQLHKEKMHNPYRGGTADVWYSGTLDDLWVEYKYLPKVPKTAQIDICKLLSPLQQQWIEGRQNEGRNVVVILGTPIGSWVYEGSEWKGTLIDRSDLEEVKVTKQDVANYIRKRTMIT
jgi:hypothetical protein